MIARGYARCDVGSGFTLVEIIVSIVVLLVLAGSMGAAVMDMRKSAMVMRRASEDLAVGTDLFDQLDAAIMNSVALDPSTGGVGLAGGSSWIEIVSRGVLADLEGEQSTLAGLARTRVEFVPQVPELRIGRGGAGARPSMQTMSRRVDWVRFRYFDGTEWADEFDSSRSGRLPSAVEVAVWFVPALDGIASPRLDLLEDADDQPAFAPSDFEGFGAPLRSEIEDTDPAVPGRAPSRYRVFGVLDSAGSDQITGLEGTP